MWFIWLAATGTRHRHRAPSFTRRSRHRDLALLEDRDGRKPVRSTSEPLLPGPPGGGFGGGRVSENNALFQCQIPRRNAKSHTFAATVAIIHRRVFARGSVFLKHTRSVWIREANTWYTISDTRVEDVKFGRTLARKPSGNPSARMNRRRAVKIDSLTPFIRRAVSYHSQLINFAAK